jgi:hypothetical protein
MFDELRGADPGTEPDNWLRQILAAYLPEIERRLGTRMTRVRGRIRQPLGCGAFGCVFLLDDGRVLKISHDDAEGAYSLFIQKMQRSGAKAGSLPVLAVTARVDDVFRFPTRKRVDGYMQTIYGIVREQVGPSDQELPPAFRQAAEVYTDGWDVFCSADGENTRRFIGGQMARVGLQRMKALGGYSAQIGAFLELCWRSGMPLMDVHVDNLARRVERGRLSEGTRRGQIVLFDFGGATSYDPGPRDPCVFARMQDLENEVPAL